MDLDYPIDSAHNIALNVKIQTDFRFDSMQILYCYSC